MGVKMRYRYLIIFIFVLFFIELPLAYIYYSGQEKAVKKNIKEIELSDSFFVSRDNPKYIAVALNRGIIHQIVLSSSGKINISLTDLEGFLVWLKDPDAIKPIEFFYQVDKLNFTYVPKETKTYYLIFETDPLLASNASVNIEISSVYVEVIREDILNTIEPILKATTVITILLFILSILPKGGLSRKKLGKTFYVLSEEAKSHDIAFLREFRGFSEKEIKVLLLMQTKARVTEKEIPKLFDISSFYKLYKMGFIEKITEL
ncbi:MAG: hypothetical protein APG12_00444 [Candidatus Methanofastidiosum methylothiophilum]|uniref:Uncharacterized protein n=1 Tax=Candidatus Methanofastidiosum methylothiophilum TaxID=1705564 RepID=A0A150J0W8_9EURY|nr:MAG: hypothetical protein APG10_00401 [Candidatus Methanofastidiosum methylthiophilus]KYC48224.1 MAG: hypothetical protein APG11_00463 [Candidatus Methanofastidiosum methylthiophilus]KYC50881.1 MAG: hypothetical protein APG12_00444 [Candidatus Methanofastidiosum methylthiophilus]